MQIQNCCYTVYEIRYWWLTYNIIILLSTIYIRIYGRKTSEDEGEAPSNFTVNPTHAVAMTPGIFNNYTHLICR